MEPDIKLLIEDYLSPEQMSKFEEYLANGYQRVGQAFFNVLSPEDQRRLDYTDVDPFYVDNRLRAALELLTSED